MIGKKVVHHLMMSAKDAHYVGGLVNGARIVDPKLIIMLVSNQSSTDIRNLK